MANSLNAPLSLAEYSAPRSSPLGGMNLAQVAQGARAETGARVAGQGNLMGAYVAQALAQQDAELRAQAEQDSRLEDEERALQAMAEETARRRLSQDSAMQAARLSAESQDNAANRSFQGAESEKAYAFELGQALANADREMSPQALMQMQTDENIREAVAMGKIQSKAEQRAVAQQQPSLADFGSQAVDVALGQVLASDNKMSERLREPMIQQRKVFGDELGIPVQYDALLNDGQDIIEKFGDDQNRVAREFRDLFGGNTRAASLALWDLGYLPMQGA